ncbi:unnamed protein product [Prunus armeniaca]
MTLLVLSFDVGLVGVSSAVDACPDRFWREFRGDLSDSAECADWSIGTACRRLVSLVSGRHLIDWMSVNWWRHADRRLGMAH